MCLVFEDELNDRFSERSMAWPSLSNQIRSILTANNNVKGVLPIGTLRSRDTVATANQEFDIANAIDDMEFDTVWCIVAPAAAVERI